MTYPLIGNYGIHDDANESRQPWVGGLVVREYSDTPSHAGSTGTIHEFLERHGIPGISGIDTRSLTLHIRDVGDTRGVIIQNAAGIGDEDLVARARNAPLPGECDVVGQVTASAFETFEGAGPHIVVVDCGVKRNIVRSLVKRGCRVTVVPFGATPEAIERLQPNGVVVSPGPGDPANLDAGLELVAGVLQQKIPYFGICLGHQLLARAIGASTSKLKFGHRGGNHPVRDQRTGRVTITSQNHGFQVDDATIPHDQDWQIALLNLNDGSIEGLTHRTLPILSVQFHPEASPGPWDNSDLFDRFLAMIGERRAAGAGSEGR
jgi:carbamoyl-phosphate synthase small subunit